jgi:cysteine-rich repeat protein
VLDAGEQCDDGNKTAGDGCNATCKLEVCGNAVLDAGEQCDDGNAVGGDGCDAQCRIELAGGVPYNLEVGGSSWTDPSSGQRWTSDQPYATGGVITNTSGVAISKTKLDPLYWTRRVGDGSGGIHFRLPVSGLGPYRVRLHFAELGGEVNASGKRVFDVLLEGGVVGLTDFDVFSEGAGSGIAVVRDLYVLVGDGELDIDLVPVAGLPPMIAAIEVLDGGAPPASPKFRHR